MFRKNGLLRSFLEPALGGLAMVLMVSILCMVFNHSLKKCDGLEGQEYIYCAR